MFVGDSIEIANLNAVLEYQLEPPLACERVFTTQLRDCLSESVTFAARFKLQEFAIRFAFFFEVAIDGNAPALDDENLFTAFFDVSEQMRREKYVSFAAVADLANQLDHSSSRGRIEPVRRLIEKNQARPVNDRLRKLGQLLHPKRVRT